MRAVCIVTASLVWIAACGSSGTSADARYVVLGSSVVRDAQTGLEWTRRDDAGDLDWYKADAYCRELRLDGGAAWRLPRIDELRTLYGMRPPTRCGEAMGAISTVFDLGGPYVWSGTEAGAGARTYLDFQFGTELSPTIAPHLVRRVLCVRSRAR